MTAPYEMYLELQFRGQDLPVQSRKDIASAFNFSLRSRLHELLWQMHYM